MRKIIILAFLAFAPVTAVNAADNAFALERFYVGGSYFYINPDSNREAGDTSALGVQVGYQINKDWDFEASNQSSAGRHHLQPWSARVRMHELQFIRRCKLKGDYQFLTEFGYTHLSMNVNKKGADDATAGVHVGVGISTFIDEDLEVRADTKLVYSPNGMNLDNITSLSLNWHF